MKFEFSFKAIPTIWCCFPNRPDIENVMLEIVEINKSTTSTKFDNTGHWLSSHVLFDELNIEPQDGNETNIKFDVSGEKLEFSGYSDFWKTWW